jgi:SAM-dependent methyltransferase
MSERNDGFRALLQVPRLFRLMQWVYGGVPARRRIIREYIQPRQGERLLDLGCGLADILDDLSDVDYFGVDANQTYIREAERRFGGRATFYCCDVADLPRHELGRFDIVLAIGLLHHLSDDEAIALLRSTKAILADHGRLVAYDPCLHDGLSPFTRWLIGLDRGRCIRSPEAYRRLAAHAFDLVEGDVREDLLRLPHSIFVMRCGTGSLSPA